MSKLHPTETSRSDQIKLFFLQVFQKIEKIVHRVPIYIASNFLYY